MQSFRAQSLVLLEKYPSFTTCHLRDAVVDFIRRGDFAVSYDLLNLGLAYRDFDAEQEVATYYGLRLLESVDPKNIERVTSLVLALCEHRGSLANPLLMERLLEAIQEAAADKEMDRILGGPPLLISWSTTLVEKTVLCVYLKSLRWREVGQLIVMGKKFKLPPLRKEAWEEIFETALQPPLVDQLSRGEAVLRMTDRNFGRLKLVLETLKGEGVKFDQPAVMALGAVLSNTIVPAEFIAYLESMQP